MGVDGQLIFLGFTYLEKLVACSTEHSDTLYRAQVYSCLQNVFHSMAGSVAVN